MDGARSDSDRPFGAVRDCTRQLGEQLRNRAPTRLRWRHDAPSGDKTSALTLALVLVRSVEPGLLLRRGVLLISCLPLAVLARRRIAARHALGLGGFAVLARQAVPAETGQVHQIDILYIGTLAQIASFVLSKGTF